MVCLLWLCNSLPFDDAFGAGLINGCPLESGPMDATVTEGQRTQYIHLAVW